MKKTFLLFALLVAGHMLFAQSADSLQAKARSQMLAGDFELSYQTLEKALQQKPNDFALLKDEAYVCYLKRDFTNGLRIGRILIQNPQADEQSYQLLGLVYKSLNENEEGVKLYKTAVEKFPSSGALYADYGDFLKMSGKGKDAIGAWEKGIQQDANSFNNYYYASKYYAETGNLVWALLYGEIFVNLESHTQRTEEVKNYLYFGYKRLLGDGKLAQINTNSKGFAKAYTDVLLKNAAPLAGDTILALTKIRAYAIADWVNNGSSKKYPFRLFDLHRQLIDAKAFTAYNEWLFGNAADAQKFEQWQAANADQMGQWQQLLQNVVFKIPAGQYYIE